MDICYELTPNYSRVDFTNPNRSENGWDDIGWDCIIYINPPVIVEGYTRYEAYLNAWRYLEYLDSILEC